MAIACTQGKHTQHVKPYCVVSDDQPDAREGQAGRFGVAERPVVPRKPGNAGGGKGPQFKINAISGKGQEIGQPINSNNSSESTEGVTRESEGRSQLSILRTVRQAIVRARFNSTRPRSPQLGITANITTWEMTASQINVRVLPSLQPVEPFAAPVP